MKDLTSGSYLDSVGGRQQNITMRSLCRLKVQRLLIVLSYQLLLWHIVPRKRCYQSFNFCSVVSDILLTLKVYVDLHPRCTDCDGATQLHFTKPSHQLLSMIFHTFTAGTVQISRLQLQFLLPTGISYNCYSDCALLRQDRQSRS